MANIKSAKKKARKDIKRTHANVFYMSKIDKALSQLRKSRSEDKGAVDVSKVYSIIDKAAKRNILSKQKAGRLKSQVASK